MNFIFDFLGSIFGYVLWFFFDAVGNYGLAVTLFTLVVNLAMFPISIKRQKSMAMQSRLNIKQQELRKKYAKNPKKLQEEQARLFEKEGHNPLGGCFVTMLLPLVLWSGIMGAVTKPLQNTLHIAPEKITQAVAAFPSLPAVNQNVMKGYEQLQIVKNFDAVKDHLTMFNEKEVSDIQELASGFNFMGLNLLNRPNAVPFSDMLWLIPVVCFLISVLGAYITQKMMKGTQPEAQGCMKFTPYALCLIMPWMSYTTPGAVGLYWVISTLFNVIQNLILNRFYNVFTVNAQSEAARAALLNIQEDQIVQIKETKDVFPVLEKKKK